MRNGEGGGSIEGNKCRTGRVGGGSKEGNKCRTNEAGGREGGEGINYDRTCGGRGRGRGRDRG
jgi:hypothetical protein